MERKYDLERIQERRPIVTSLLDTDFYKLTMGQFVFHRYADVPVNYEFKNRTQFVRLAEVVDEKELREELDQIRPLGLNEREVEYLRQLKNNGQQLFKEDYLAFLRNPKMPQYDLKVAGKDYELKFKGNWANAIYWETPALAVMNELYYRGLTGKMNQDQLEAIYEEGEKNLEKKIELFQANPETIFLEFGTRRRWSRDWQDYVVETLKERIPNQIIGTSNVQLAMKHGLAPKGTMAHEMFMVMSGIMHKNKDEIRASHNQVLTEWWEEYGKGLSIALTDTYGSKFFFEDMNLEQARNYAGLRQDSGDPARFAELQIAFYKEKGIDAREKMFVPSDGLNAPKIIDLQNQFREKIMQAAGYGTNLTNDLGYKALSMVVKATEANGHGTVKLSDNPAKSMGKPKDVAMFREIFGYNPDDYKWEECKY